MNYYPEFAALLDRYLGEADRSGAWLAQRLAVNPATLTRWRNGDTRPNSPELVIRLADVLGIHKPSARQQLLHAAGYGYAEGAAAAIESLPESDKIPSDVSDRSEREVTTSSAFEIQSLGEVKQLLNYGVEIFGETLSSILGSRNISQQRLATWIGVSPSAVSQWRTGTRIPDAATLYNIGSELELESSEISALLTAWAATRTIAGLLDYLTNGGDAVNLEAIKDALQKLEIRKLMKLPH